MKRVSVVFLVAHKAVFIGVTNFHVHNTNIFGYAKGSLGYAKTTHTPLG